MVRVLTTHMLLLCLTALAPLALACELPARCPGSTPCHNQDCRSSAPQAVCAMHGALLSAATDRPSTEQRASAPSAAARLSFAVLADFAGVPSDVSFLPRIPPPYTPSLFAQSVLLRV